MFTREELESYLKNNLITLAKYYNVVANIKMKKGEIVDALLENTQAEVELPQMSVRVRRIYESQKE